MTGAITDRGVAMQKLGLATSIVTTLQKFGPRSISTDVLASMLNRDGSEIEDYVGALVSNGTLIRDGTGVRLSESSSVEPVQNKTIVETL
jgi:hypothetical protein